MRPRIGWVLRRGRVFVTAAGMALLPVLAQAQPVPRERITNALPRLEAMIDRIIAANAEKVGQFRAGKVALKGWFVGQVMKATQGKANPAAVNDILDRKLKG